MTSDTEKSQEDSSQEESFVSVKKARSSKNRKKRKGAKPARRKVSNEAIFAKYPRHSVDKVLRIPKAILEQNAGKDCSEQETAQFVGVGLNGPFRSEISSAIKYGFLTRPSPGRVKVTELAKTVLRPQQPNDSLTGLRQAVMNAPEFGEVYNHYRGENLPDRQFFENALVDKFHLPKEKVSEFIDLFLSSLEAAGLSENIGGKTRIIDVSKDASTLGQEDTPALRKLSWLGSTLHT